MANKHRVQEFNRDLIDHTLAVLKRHNINDAAAADIAHALAHNIAQAWGGLNVYFPKRDSVALNARDQAIWDEFNGDNHSELAKKYNVSVQWVYKVVKRKRAADIQSRQQSFLV